MRGLIGGEMRMKARERFSWSPAESIADPKDDSQDDLKRGKQKGRPLFAAFDK